MGTLLLVLLPLLATLVPMLPAMATLAPSTSTPTWSPTPTVPWSPLTSPLLLLPVLTTSPPRELPLLLLVPLLLPLLSLPSLLLTLPQLLTATAAPSTSTPTWSPTPMVPSSPLMSPPLLLPVPTTSPPRVPSTRKRLERTHVSHFGVLFLRCVNFAQTRTHFQAT